MSLINAKRPSGRTQEHIQRQLPQVGVTKRLSVDLPEAEFKRLKVYAAANGMTITELVRGWIAEHIPE